MLRDTWTAFQEALRRGEAAPAVAAFRALAASDPVDPRLLRWIEAGRSAFAALDGDISALSSVQAARGDPLAALLLIGRAAFGAGATACALALARRAGRDAPDRAEPAFLLCAMLLASGDTEAQAVLQRCLTRWPEPSTGWAMLGAVLQARGQGPAALVCFARGRPSAGLALRRGRLAREIGRRAAAREAFAEAVRLDPRSAPAWFLLGTMAQDAKDFAAAAAAYRTALALDPGVAEAAVNLGTVLQEQGDLEAARAAYRRAVETRADTFGRVAQALSTSPRGELWLDLAALRRSLGG